MEALRKEKRLPILLKLIKKKLSHEEKKIQEKQRLLNRTPEVKLAKDAARTEANVAKNLKQKQLNQLNQIKKST